MTLVWDTGALYVLTPFRRSDFIDYVKYDILFNDVTKVNRVIRIVTTIHRFMGSNGQDLFLTCISYHLTKIYVRLFFPHTYCQIPSGHYVVQRNKLTMRFPNHRINIPIDIGGDNLPVIHNLFVTENQNRSIFPQMRSSLAYSILSKVVVFGYLNSIQYLRAMDISRKQIEIE